MTTLWHIMPAAPPDVLAALGEYTPLGAQLLHNRGLGNPAAARSYLEPAAVSWPDPFLLPDMQRAVDLALAARGRGDTVAVYGDYDADGITGTTVLIQGLHELGITALPYIPHRDREGYGLNQAALEGLQELGARLVVTVDNGTSAVEEIAHAGGLGLDVVVLDHHTIPPELPNAPIVNPHRKESRYPFDGFAGVGVAFKFLQALAIALGRPPEMMDSYADLVAIGTVADLTPLEGENRRIVRAGLDIINRRPRPGLAALIERSSLQPGHIGARDLAFTIAPRLNAMGRLEHAMASYRLLASGDLAEGRVHAEELDTTNRARQQLTVELVDQARAAIAADEAPDALVLVSGPGYPVGMVGLVAGRLAEEWYLPAVVIEEGARHSRGSARSIPGLSIVDLLGECQDLLLRYGGHSQAAGFTIETINVPQLRTRLQNAASRAMGAERPQRFLNIEAVTGMRAIPGKVMGLLNQLSPFGAGNPEPLFLSRRAQVLEARPVGATGAHLEVKLKESGAVWRAMGFNMGHRAAEASRAVDVVYSMGIDHFQGTGAVQLQLKDFRPASPE